MKEQLLAMAPELIGLALTLVLGYAARIGAKLVDAKLDGRNRAIVVDVASTAYRVIEKLSTKTETKIDDKCAKALGEFVDLLGRRPSAEELMLARATFAKLAHEPPGGLVLVNREMLP